MATTASTRNFQRRFENAIQYASGRPMTSRRSETITASSSVSQNVCQSIDMRLDLRENSLHPASWRNDPVHTQVDHHLTIVVEPMGRNRHCQPQARYLAFAKRTPHGLRYIALVDRSDGLVHIREGILQILDDVSLAGKGSRAGFIANVHGRFLLENGGSEFVVYGRDVLDLLSVGPHAFKLAAAGGETVLVFRHRFGRGDELVFKIAD